MIHNSSVPKQVYGVLVWALLFLIFILSGCNNGGDQAQQTQSSETGALAFKAAWPQPENRNAKIPTESTENTENVCTTFGIETITASVEDAQGTERGSGRWLCNTEGHSGTISEIPVGNGYRVLVQGLIGENTAWHGQATNITIEGGKTAVIDKIIMHDLEFTLTASSSDGGRIEPSGSIAASSISEHTFSFTANANYEIDDVFIDGAPQGYMESYTFSNIDVNHSIYVSFVSTGTSVTTHTITATAGAGGSIVPEGSIEVTEGNDQTFTFVPDTGNHVADVFVDDVSQGAKPNHTFENVTEDHTIRVAFDTTTYTISATAGPGGQIGPSGDVTAAHGTEPAFTISPDEGYYLSGLQVNGADILPQGTYTFPPVAGNATITAVFNRVHFVDDGAAPGGVGTTWPTAFRTLPEAIQAASNGDEIWIKGGTYFLTSQISVNKNVTIYGGFSDTDHFLHERDWNTNQVVLDGQGATRCLFITTDAYIDGITAQNGTVGSGTSNLQAGALYIDNCSPTLVNCTFRNNQLSGSYDNCYGGAVYADNSSPSFENCRFEGNQLHCVNNYGGAVALHDSTTVINNCSFNNNNIESGFGCRGGGVDIDRGDATIENSNFTSNRVGGESASGGAISGISTDLTISGSLFKENIAAGYYNGRAGALYLSQSNTTDAVINNSIFLLNRCEPENPASDIMSEQHGGAIFNSDTAPGILNCTFFSNSTKGASLSGGGITNTAASPTITNTILWGNLSHVIEPDMVTITTTVRQLHDDDESSNSIVSYSAIDQSGYTGNGNLREDPQLDAFGHLRQSSPCLDMGDDASAPAIDIDGEPRPQNGNSDMGADEFLDSDGDGMPDYWESKYGLSTSVDDADGDLDSDQLSNLEEYQTDQDPTVANLVVNALHRGWYDQNGFHEETDNATLCSVVKINETTMIDYRSYFIFDLSGQSGTVTGAILRLELAEFRSSRSSKNFDVYDVTTDSATLEASGSGQTAIYQDLGGGTRYVRDYTISPNDELKIINIHLPADAISDIAVAMGGHFALGIESSPQYTDETESFLFSIGSEARVHQLVLIVE